MSVIKVQISLRLDPVIHTKLKIISEKENRSLSNMIDYLIKQKINNYELNNGEIELTYSDIYTLY